VTLPDVAYVRPASLEDACAHLARDGARALAGGQSLVPALAARSGVRPRTLVDLTALPGLDELALGADGRLSVGALVRQRTAQRSPLVLRHAPMLAQALGEVGFPATRNRGTVVGSLMHADPAAEVPAVAVALDGVASVAGPGGARRSVAAADLLAQPLRPGELVTSLSLAVAVPGEHQAWSEFAPRRFDLPLVGVAARARPGTGARLEASGLVVGGVGATPVDASALAAGTALQPGPVRVLAERVACALRPADDARASGDYRRRVACTLIARTLLSLGATEVGDG
jgi:carbon-monoxide dehydrogenase medium subunit